MADNNQIVLQTLIEQNRKELYSELSVDDYFHLFVTEQVMKDAELSYDEIEEGIVDNGGDGGIDSIYTFVNQELVQRDSELIDGKRNSVIDVYILQSKNVHSFGETPIEKCNSSAIDIFDLSKSIDSLRTVYNSDLLVNVEVFRKQYLHLASKFPVLRFHYFYITKGSEIHPNVERKVEILVSSIKKHFDKAEVLFDFVTAKKLIDLSRKEQLRSKDVVLNDNPISTQDGGYIAIVPIKNYHDFITDDNANLIRYFFDANIRDYQVNVDVNKEIRKTLINQNENEDFWWLNNGVTITAIDATFASKKLHIEDPQIVNGLQTSFEIHKYFSENKIEKEKRNVLLRVIKVQDEKSRLNVIKATNSQTNIPPASLRATDPIHRDIEDFLFSKGYYYDRRKNYHKNQGKPVNKIISIPYLAQIITGIYNQKPDYARARPSTLIKNNSDYQNIFKDNLSLEMYHKGILIQKKVEILLKEYDSPKLSRPQIGDIKFHVAMYVTAILCDIIKPTSEDIGKIDISKMTDEIVKNAIQNTYIVYDAMGGTNSVAKGNEFVKEVLEQVQNELKDMKEVLSDLNK
ncbi:AIPR family protein [Tenacibaculum caenipelagi]|uniref:AIPR protein n=1 Tax=Tenacibaculum caenipelagi TaxID=1325435 RepID=A0A4R6TEH5_9FLAO|nr:AIPR family protein [Tenacibaculum caenipelagi]TDQ28695.1 AIPR protein [Tenacibaculum caenipelagi]